MAKDDDTITIEKTRVVLVGFEQEKDKYNVIKALAKELSYSFEEASEVVESIPVEIIQPLPMEAAENLAERLRPEGAQIELIPLSRDMGGGRTCYRHPHKLAMAKCKVCGKLVCNLCLIETRGKLYCKDHFRRFKYLRFGKYVGGFGAVALLFFLWLFYGESIGLATKKIMPLSTQRIAMVIFTDNADTQASEFYGSLMRAGTRSQFKKDEDHDFADLVSWFQLQYKEVTHNKDFDVFDLDIYGLFDTLEAPPVFDLPSKSEDDLKTYLKNLAERNSFKIEAYDYYLFVFLIGQSPFIDDYIDELGAYDGKFGVFLYPLDRKKSSDHYVFALSHLLARMMGAAPRMDNRRFPLFPEGFAEPESNPLYPQTNAELMGGYIPLNEDKVKPIDNLDQAIIRLQTAYEIGWISNRYYRKASQITE